MKLKCKKLTPEAQIPSYAYAGDAGLDLVATSITIEHYRNNIIYGTGLAFEIPEGHVGLLFPRSSIHKKDFRLVNSVGVIDSNYRGEVKLIFRKDTHFLANDIYNLGDKIGQLVIVPIPQIEIEEVDELEESERNTKGFGSSGD